MRILESLDYGNFIGPIWEPAAGRGDMSRALCDYGDGYDVHSSDIDLGEFDTSIGPSHEGSFLDEFEVPYFNNMVACRSIITNPPYSEPTRGIADNFIRQGLSFFDQEIVFMAMLLRSEFKSGKSRADIFGECQHYMGEIVLTTRPRWDYGDPDRPEDAAPRTPFSWFMWKKDCRLGGAGRMAYYPNQYYSYMPKGFKP